MIKNYLQEFEKVKDEFLLKINETDDIKGKISEIYLKDIFRYFSLVKENCEVSNYDSLVPQVRSILEHVKKNIFFLQEYHDVLYLLMQLIYTNEAKKMVKDNLNTLSNHLKYYQRSIELEKAKKKYFPYNTFTYDRFSKTEILKVIEHNNNKIQANIKIDFLKETIIETTKDIKYNKHQEVTHEKTIKKLEVKICDTLCNCTQQNCKNNKCKIFKINDWIQFSNQNESKRDTSQSITSIANEYFGIYYKALCTVNHSNAIVEKIMFDEKSTFDKGLIFLLGDIIGSYFIQLNIYYPIKSNDGMILWEQKMRDKGEKLKTL